MRAESTAMALCRRVGLERIAWSLRRLHCPVSKDALVLEVGSGGNPYARADVLLDAYENTRERHWVPLKADRPTVLGFVERLPFRDKVFDFVIASHVLEHSADPEQFLVELQRVAKAGYIEVPDAFFERINPYRDHRLEITQRDGKLVIRKKPAQVVDRDLVELYEDRAKPYVTRQLFPRYPFAFHVRYYWHGKIDYVVVNPEADAAWVAPENARDENPVPGLRQRVQGLVLGMLQTVGSGLHRRKQVDLMKLLRCPVCRSERLKAVENTIRCEGCNRIYPVRSNIPVMQEPAAVSLVREHAVRG
jgi:uncharacterized protein YbaR (Trm112 family)/SAM-dependent methyltransferase